jgi:predicted nucleotidyltransferase
MLGKAEARQIAIDYSMEVKKALNPDKIVLFGSFVYGNPHGESDIDVAVFKTGLEDDAWYNARILLQRLRRNKSFLDIEPHLLDEANDASGFAEHVIKNGEVIYQA